MAAPSSHGKKPFSFSGSSSAIVFITKWLLPVRTKKPLIREDGTSIKFDSNAAVLLDKQNEPIGTRIFGPVTRELRKRNMMKIVSLAPEVL